MTAKTTPRLKCALCGRWQDADKVFTAKWGEGMSGYYYCADTYKCQRRAKKAARNDN